MTSPRSEYERMRGHAGLADLEDWSRFDLSGPDADEVLDALVGCNVRDLFEGRIANTLIPSESGGVDAIVWVITLEDGFRILGEPSDREAIRSALEQSVSGRDARFRDLRDEQFALALIGPEAEGIAARAFGDEVYSIAFLSTLALGDPALLAARIGYFGEYELYLFGEAAARQDVVDTLLRAAGDDALLVGDGAFPAMMIEMRTLNRERDIPAEVSVFEAGVQWMIDFRKDNLRAAPALRRRKGTIERKGVLMLVDAGAADLRGSAVYIEERDVGRVQSVFFSDTLGRSVALAYLVEELGVPGLSCAVGADRVPGETVSAPAFLSRSVLDRLS